MVLKTLLILKVQKIKGKRDSEIHQAERETRANEFSITQ